MTYVNTLSTPALNKRLLQKPRLSLQLCPMQTDAYALQNFLKPTDTQLLLLGSKMLGMSYKNYGQVRT